MTKIKYLVVLLVTISLSGCGAYNFTGAKPVNAKTFQVNFFQNNAELIEPGIDRIFTQRLQNLIQDQTNLSLTNTNGELIYEGEIVDYRVTPMTATAEIRTAQNRLTIAINVRFVNKNKEEDNFEKRFSHFYDFGASEQLTGPVLTAALEDIFERITQDIFNASLAKW